MQLLSQAPTEIDTGTIAVVYRYESDGSARRGSHRHPTLHQLSWAPTGVIEATVEGTVWTFPPTLAIWIPAGMLHEVRSMNGRIECFDMKAHPQITPVDWPGPQLIPVTPLFRSLITHLAEPGLTPGERRRAVQVLFDQFRPATVPGIDVPMPRDPRARAVAVALLRDPADDRSLAEWAPYTRASVRTLTRLIRSETGMAFNDWRLQIRIAAALSHLAAGDTVTAAGRKVGYRNASAFIDAFRRRLGITPGEFCTQYLL